MKKSSNNANIFLIHAHKDRDAVRKFYQRLVKDGLNVWLDAERLEPGQNWQNEIRKALIQCDVVIVCLTRNFDKQRGYRHEELKLALEKAKFIPTDQISIIPIRLEECDMPESLQHLHRVDLFKQGGYKRLTRTLLK